MTPELEQRIAALEQFVQSLRDNGTIPFDVGNAITARVQGLIGSYPSQLSNAPRAAITAPSGGATVDSQARSAINSIISALEELGLVQEN